MQYCLKFYAFCIKNKSNIKSTMHVFWHRDTVSLGLLSTVISTCLRGFMGYWQNQSAVLRIKLTMRSILQIPSLLLHTISLHIDYLMVTVHAFFLQNCRSLFWHYFEHDKCKYRLLLYHNSLVFPILISGGILL